MRRGVRAASLRAAPGCSSPARASTMNPITAYIHFPWCLKKCPYCDFVSFAKARDAIDHRGYADAVLAEPGQHGEPVALPPSWLRQRVQPHRPGHLVPAQAEDVQGAGVVVVGVAVGQLEQALLGDEHLRPDAQVRLALVRAADQAAADRDRRLS